MVSIVMPVRNEGPYLAASLDAIDRQSYPADRIEIMVVDGGSTDDTLEVLSRRASLDPRIRILGGPGVNTPQAMNVGTGAATGRYVAKVDGHGYVNDRFVEAAVTVLEADPSVGCVGGAIVPIATTPVQKAIEVARFSVLGVGGGIYTAPHVVHDIDTVQCGVYRAVLLGAIGGFDPDLQFGEDEEVNFRFRSAGSRIVFDPEIEFHYHVRPSLASLFRQYYNYGGARVRVVRKHPSFLRPKHLVPAALVIALVGSLVASLVNWRIPVVVVGGYAAALVVAGLALANRRRQGSGLLVAGALGCLHLAYGLGVLRGLLTVIRPAR